MARQKVVVDASVAIKWFLDEEGSEEAEKLLREHASGKLRIFAPDLIFYELLNGLRYAGYSDTEFEEAILDLIGIQLHVERPTRLLLTRTAKIALGNEFTFYDASYIALAELLDTSLITVDKELLQYGRAEGLGDAL